MQNTTAVQTIPFSFDGHEVRTQAMPDGEAWFVAHDVAEALGYSKTRNAIERHCKGALKRGIPTSSGEQQMTIIREPDVYRLIVKSRLPSAERFERWVFEDVLPTIRKTGHYSSRPQNSQPDLHESAIEFAKLAMGCLPNLGESSKQQLLSEASRLAYGERLIPLPVVEENLLTATQVGEKLGITANKVGRIAKSNNLKTEEYGEWRLDKSRSSSKQVESFCYKPCVVPAIQSILEAA